jgi:hypothetical protein
MLGWLGVGCLCIVVGAFWRFANLPSTKSGNRVPRRLRNFAKAVQVNGMQDRAVRSGLVMIVIGIMLAIVSVANILIGSR